MADTRLPKKAYKMLYELHCKDKRNWASEVCFVLYRYGFGFVWENQGVTQINQFISIFKQRLLDCHLQELHNSIKTNERFTLYSSFCQLSDTPDYLNIVTNPVLRKWLTRVRFGVSSLNPHFLRFSSGQKENNCPFCKQVRECELHFILQCPYYDDLRVMYISVKYYRRPNICKLGRLLADRNHCVQLSIFLSKAFCRRNKIGQVSQR